MTFRPVNPYDLLVQQLMQNVERTSSNLEQGFQAQREERLIGEERETQDRRIQQQRAWQVQDYQRQRKDLLTDQARTLQLGYLEQLREVSPYVRPDDERYGAYQAAMQALSQPTGLEGDEAVNQLLGGRFVVEVDGRPTEVLLHDLIGYGVRNRSTVQQVEGWRDNLIEMAVNALSDTTLDDPVRQAWADLVLANKDIPFEMKDTFLLAANVHDPEQRRRIILGDEGLELEVQGARLGVAAASIELGMLQVDGEWYERFKQLDWDERQAALAQTLQNTSLGAIESFFTYGFLPDDERARGRLAAQLGIPIAELEDRARAHQERFIRLQDTAVMTAEEQLALLGRQVVSADLSNEMNRLLLDRERFYGEIAEQMGLAEKAAAAMRLGDTEALMHMQRLARVPGYESAFAGIDFPALIERAQFLRGDGDDQLAFAQANRDATLRALARGEIFDYDAFAAQVAATMLDADFSVSPDGSVPGLEAEVDAYLRRVPDAQLDDSGLTREQWRERIIAEALRQRALRSRDEAGAVVDSLFAAIPGPDSPHRPAWEASVKDALARTGLYTPAEAEALVGARQEVADLARAGQLAGLRLTNQQADQSYAETLARLQEVIRNGQASLGLSLDEYSDMVNIWKAVADGEVQFMTQACGLTVMGSDMVLDFRTFDWDNADCSGAATRQQEAVSVMRALASNSTFGADGTVALAVEALQDLTSPLASPEADAVVVPEGEEFERILAQNVADADAFDRDSFAALTPENQREVFLGVQRGESAASMNVAMNAMLAWERGRAVVDMADDLPSLADVKRDFEFNSLAESAPEASQGGQAGEQRTWESLSVEDRVPLLEGTREWVQLATDVYNGRVDLEAMDRAWLEARAEEFGFVRPLQGLEHLNPRFWSLERGTREVRFSDVGAMRQALTQTIQNVVMPRANQLMAGSPPRVPNTQPADEEAPAAPAAPAPGAPQAGPFSVTYGALPGVNPATPFGSGIDVGAMQQGMSVQGVGQPGQAGGSVLERTPSAPQGRPWGQYVPQAESVLDALVQQESGGRHVDASGNLTRNAVSGALGVTQVLPKTAANPGFGVDPLRDHSEAEYLRFGRDYLAAMLARYNGDMTKALAAYNAGAGNVDRAVSMAVASGMPATSDAFLQFLPRPQETVPYVRNILAMAGAR